MNKAIYVIVTPVRNEAEHLPETIASMVAQTCPPKKWIIVNDGSTDGTREIIDTAAKEHTWVEVVHRPDRGFRKSGGGVIEAFYDGYRSIEAMRWDYIVKLDGDLSIEPSFFSSCFDHFNQDAKLGIGGGTICGLVDGALVEESHGDPSFHVRGATKIYRRACWQAIGGLIRAPGWDTVDELKANMLGWKTYSFLDLKLRHHRHTGMADGAWKNWVKNGVANYISGYHPVFMLLKCFRRMLRHPLSVEGLGLAFGYITCYVKRIPRYDDRDLIRYVWQQQWRAVTLRNSLWAKRSANSGL